MNPYTVLGVSETATDAEISAAYKRLAKRYHPDLHPGDQEAARKMSELNNAYKDVKSMRASGQSYSQYSASQQRPGARPGSQSYQSGSDPFTGGPFNGNAHYTYTYYNPFSGFTGQRQNDQTHRMNPLGMVFAVFVVMLLVRLLVSMLFGGYGGSYYVNGNTGYGNYVPGYGMVYTEPAQDQQTQQQSYSGWYSGEEFPGMDGASQSTD